MSGLLTMTESGVAYKNSFLYFVFEPQTDLEGSSFIYCSGVNIDKIMPITRGRHRRGMNPAVKGLQSVNHGVISLAIDCGATVKPYNGNACMGVNLLPEDLWYTEALSIQDPSAGLFQKAISYAATGLLKVIFTACMLEEDLPDSLYGPDELERFINGLCNKYGGHGERTNG
jgi:hypothetical protein